MLQMGVFRLLGWFLGEVFACGFCCLWGLSLVGFVARGVCVLWGLSLVGFDASGVFLGLVSNGDCHFWGF